MVHVITLHVIYSHPGINKSLTNLFIETHNGTHLLYIKIYIKKICYIKICMLNVTTSNQEKVVVIQVTSKSNASIDDIIVNI